MADIDEDANVEIEIPENAELEVPEETKQHFSDLVENISLENMRSGTEKILNQLVAWAQSPEFYAQIALIVGAIFIAFIAAKAIGRNFHSQSVPPQAGSMSRWRGFLYRAKGILFPLFAVVFLAVASAISEAVLQQNWLSKFAQGLAVIALIYFISKQFISSSVVRKFIKWVIIPLALLHVFGWLEGVTTYLDSIKLQLGNITLSLHAIARVLIFGSILFWLGRVSNDSGKEYIRKQENLEVGTREVIAKLFEIGLFFLVFILLLQLMGISLTALAVFGGALGVGLGFGLQAIASNFISGMILLLDRSLTVGDYIELEDGRGGVISALNMRSTILETFDGKDIVVPNETFVTSSFTNWTHADIKQRYSIEFQVSYDTDMEKLVEIIKEVVATHPQVISGEDATPEEQPDAEINSFADSGIEVLVEFWMEGVDDGANRVDADLKMMIWKALKENNISFPFPQREVRILNPS